MAQLIAGIWSDSPPAAEEIKDGSFRRIASDFRETIAPGGEFAPEAGRYVLFVAFGCPWASRTLAVRAIKDLEEIVEIAVAAPTLGPQGWMFEKSPDGEVGPFPLHRLYTMSDPQFSGKVTVPTLWDRRTRTIVNNESSEIVRMFNTAFNGLVGNHLDLYPVKFRPIIDQWNDYIYPNLNNGVYRAGFASKQSAYEIAVLEVFAALDRLEEHLGTHRYLAGEVCTEADWRLFVTLVRFDVAYYGAFKCNIRRLEDYDNLPNYLRELYQWPKIAGTVALDQIKAGYWALASRTPTIPMGPQLDLTRAHDRERLRGSGIASAAAA